MNNIESRFNIISFDNIAEESIEWLWEPYFPLGLISIIAGDPGVGKSFQSIHLASIVSNGGIFPYTTIPIDCGNVIIQNAEDLKGATIKKRLIDSGADCSKIAIIELKDIDDKKGDLLFKDIKELDIIFELYKPKLVIFDPITNFLGDIDMNSATKVRPLLSPIAKLANKFNCAIVFIIHRNKATNSGNSLHRVMGSADFGGIARSVISIGKNPQNKDEVLFMHTKSNVARLGKTLAFKINDGVIEWLGERDYIDDSYSNDNTETEYPRQRAMKFIINYLKENGNSTYNDILQNANKNNISEKTLTRARTELQNNGLVEKKNNHGNVIWGLVNSVCPNAQTIEVGKWANQ